MANTSTKQSILQSLLHKGESSAQSLAQELDLSPQAIRRHLKDLETAGLVTHVEVLPQGLGRPQHHYHLSPAGRAQFPTQYDEFALSLLDTLAETVGKEQVTSILHKQWHRKALTYRELLGELPPEQRVAQLVELRRAEGYMADWYVLPPTAAGPQFMLTEHNCAISTVAESFPSICGHELQMFMTALPDAQVQRTHWLIDGETRCGYLIQFHLGVGLPAQPPGQDNQKQQAHPPSEGILV